MMNADLFRAVRRLTFQALCGAALLAGVSVEAGQLVPNLKHEGTLAGYDATYSATVLTSTTAEFTITILNTTPPSTGGALTAFAFNTPGVVTGVTLDTSSFIDNRLFTNVNTPGDYGTFDFGLSTGSGAWQGGTVSKGVAAQATGTFTFDLVGNFTGLTGSQLTDLFLASFSTGGGGNTPSIFAARFQGLPGSDTQVSIQAQAVPEPSSLLMGGLALAGLAGLSHARRRRSA